MEFEKMLDHLERPDMTRTPDLDLARVGGAGLTHDEAYKLQFALMQRRASRGDRIVGYQASFTSAGAKTIFPQYPAPVIGTLLRSNMKLDDAPASFDYPLYFIESEIAVVFKKDLAGADLTPHEVVCALEGYLAAVEFAPLRPGTLEGKLSAQQLIATHNTDSKVLLGRQMLAPTTDMRAEGVIVSIDGSVRGSATGVEAMGGPINVVISLAAILARHGLGFKAGQVLITGTLAPPQKVVPGDREATVEFTRLGKLSIALAH